MGAMEPATALAAKKRLPSKGRRDILVVAGLVKASIVIPEVTVAVLVVQGIVMRSTSWLASWWWASLCQGASSAGPPCCCPEGSWERRGRSKCEK